MTKNVIKQRLLIKGQKILKNEMEILDLKRTITETKL